jgi:hypothetical protein
MPCLLTEKIIIIDECMNLIFGICIIVTILFFHVEIVIKLQRNQCINTLNIFTSVEKYVKMAHPFRPHPHCRPANWLDLWLQLGSYDKYTIICIHLSREFIIKFCRERIAKINVSFLVITSLS